MILKIYKHNATNRVLNDVVFDDNSVSFVLGHVTKSMALIAFVASYSLLEW